MVLMLSKASPGRKKHQHSAKGRGGKHGSIKETLWKSDFQSLLRPCASILLRTWHLSVMKLQALPTLTLQLVGSTRRSAKSTLARAWLMTGGNTPKASIWSGRSASMLAWLHQLEMVPQHIKPTAPDWRVLPPPPSVVLQLANGSCATLLHLSPTKLRLSSIVQSNPANNQEKSVGQE